MVPSIVPLKTFVLSGPLHHVPTRAGLHSRRRSLQLSVSDLRVYRRAALSCLLSGRVPAAPSSRLYFPRCHSHFPFLLPHAVQSLLSRHPRCLAPSERLHCCHCCVRVLRGSARIAPPWICTLSPSFPVPPFCDSLHTVASLRSPHLLSAEPQYSMVTHYRIALVCLVRAVLDAAPCNCTLSSVTPYLPSVFLYSRFRTLPSLYLEYPIFHNLNSIVKSIPPNQLTTIR